MRGKSTLGGRDLHDWDQRDRGRFCRLLAAKRRTASRPPSYRTSPALPIVEGEHAVQAAKDCGVHELISGLADGYDTKVGVDAKHLSAGQAQAIGLARAMFADPVLIVLDEPSSNLDSFTVARLKKTLANKRAAGRIVILATHDARLIKEADQVLLLSKKEIKLVTGDAYYAALTGKRPLKPGGTYRHESLALNVQ